jgi:hypothetical protein
MLTHKELEEYRDNMECPMENLAMALECPGGPTKLRDAELVERAAKKIETLRKIVLSAGPSQGILDAIMAE